MDKLPWQKKYSGRQLDRVAFPLGGLGAGMLCMEGNGALSNMSVRHIPQMGFNSIVYASLCVKRPHGNIARVLEGPVPSWKIVDTRDAHSGCCDDQGCCPGSCTHVWNYAQALAHLFPDLERGLRATEFGDNQDEHGHQNFRAALPIGPVQDHSFHAAADGQLGGIVKVYRDWRLSGDTEWLRTLWPRVKQCLNYCIETWDPPARSIGRAAPQHVRYRILGSRRNVYKHVSGGVEGRHRDGRHAGGRRIRVA